MRGTRNARKPETIGKRFIPAHAGTHRDRRRTLRNPRFIPAHAGNTPASCRRVRSVAVHPRACGEHGHDPILRLTVCGSSPRMRGTRVAKQNLRLVERFIPAHAGNTSANAQTMSSRPVHPRACGEHASFRISSSVNPGSSPRMRGTLPDGRRKLLAPRFIPAHAGNTFRRPHRCQRSPVHPRACGEHSSQRDLDSLHIFKDRASTANLGARRLAQCERINETVTSFKAPDVASIGRCRPPDAG